MGWEPTETHAYAYDEHGRLLAVTVTREPEWDDVSREEMLGLAEFEAGICDCGFHKSLTRDKRNVFSFEVDTCPVCAGRARYDRLQRKDDAEVQSRMENAPPTAPRPGDGRHVHMQVKLGD